MQNWQCLVISGKATTGKANIMGRVFERSSHPNVAKRLGKRGLEFLGLLDKLDWIPKDVFSSWHLG